MLAQAALLFFSAFLGGIVVLLLPEFRPNKFRIVLVFTGSYLFAITILHFLPALFVLHPNHWVSFWVLLGFFLQLFLGLFSKGIEHGHTYEAETGVQAQRFSAFALFSSLGIHAFLDGIILSNVLSTHWHHTYTTARLLIGLFLHKGSEAFALVTVLAKMLHTRRLIFLYLLCFSIASPLGLWFSDYCSQQVLLSQESFVALAAIAGGSFLHISTTIFFESNPQHHFNLQRLLASLGGAGLVVLLEYWL